MTEFLGIDPGTINLGWAVFEGDPGHERPKHIGSYNVSDKLTADIRTTAMVSFITGELLEYNSDISLVVCEKWLGPRNPQLQTLITVLGQTIKRMGLGWQLYHNSSVFKSVAPRGYRGKHTDQRKKAIRDGVLGLYPELRSKLAKYHPDHVQDALDAVAVGVCHIGVMKVKEIELRTDTDG